MATNTALCLINGTDAGMLWGGRRVAAEAHIDGRLRDCGRIGMRIVASTAHKLLTALDLAFGVAQSRDLAGHQKIFRHRIGVTSGA
jgi:hypothetical protein